MAKKTLKMTVKVVNQYFIVSGDRVEEIAFHVVTISNVLYWVSEKIDDMCMG